jgi:N-methylhydantoinase A
MVRIGIDVGGTFTDVVLVDETTGAVQVAKVLNEPGRRYATVVRGISRVMDMAGVRPEEVSFIGHGTTITTNAVIERKGARIALITNKGFRDVIEIGRFSRPADLIYRVQMDKPSPLVPRHLRFEADCRINAQGEVLKDLKQTEVDRLVAQVRESGVRAVAICLLFSFLVPRHEQTLRDALRKALPDVDILISSDVLPEFREFPRTSTTLFAAYVAPVLRSYIEKLIEGLRETRVDSRLFIFQSNGGVGRPDLVMRNPATTLLSGPAGAVVGAANLARVSGHTNLITMDMGGTSLDVCLLRQGKAEATTAREIDYFPIVTPMLDVHTVGAGGGSIVRLDDVGRLKVGPESASSDPGPACYGLGGDYVTLTDVNLVLGYIDADDFADGAVKLHPERARAVIERDIAGPLGVSLQEAAAGIFKVAASQMAEAIRFVSVQRGADPRDFELCPFGGGGPIHAFSIAAELGMQRILVPNNPGLFSAGGISVADFTHDYSRSVLKVLETQDASALAAEFEGLRKRAQADFELEGVAASASRFERSMDLRYAGQTTEINIRVASDSGTGAPDIASFIAEFHRQHEAVYTYSVPGEPVELVNIRLRAIGEVAKPNLLASQPQQRSARSERTRDAWFNGQLVSTRVIRREGLEPGERVVGPAIIQELSSATVLPPGAEAVVDAHRNLLVSLNQGH